MKKIQKKNLQRDFKRKTEAEFEKTLPINRDDFTSLFNYLDIELSVYGCDNTSILTKNFLMSIKSDDSNRILEWLEDKGGYCDCEILANVEDYFE